MQDFGVAAVLRCGSRRKYWMVGKRLVGRLLADSPAIPNSQSRRASCCAWYLTLHFVKPKG